MVPLLLVIHWESLCSFLMCHESQSVVPTSREAETRVKWRSATPSRCAHSQISQNAVCQLTKIERFHFFILVLFVVGCFLPKEEREFPGQSPWTLKKKIKQHFEISCLNIAALQWDLDHRHPKMEAESGWSHPMEGRKSFPSFPLGSLDDLILNLT